MFHTLHSYIQPQIPAADHHHLYYHHPIINGNMEILSTGCSQLKMWISTFTLNKLQQTSTVKDISVRSINKPLSLTFLLPECYLDIVTQFYKIHMQLYKFKTHVFLHILEYFMILQQIWIQCQIGLFNLICFIYFYWTQHKQGKYFVKHLTIICVQSENATYVITKL
jgi:hypothetical protein